MTGATTILQPEAELLALGNCLGGRRQWELIQSASLASRDSGCSILNHSGVESRSLHTGHHKQWRRHFPARVYGNNGSWELSGSVHPDSARWNSQSSRRWRHRKIAAVYSLGRHSVRLTQKAQMKSINDVLLAVAAKRDISAFLRLTVFASSMQTPLTRQTVFLNVFRPKPAIRLAFTEGWTTLTFFDVIGNFGIITRQDRVIFSESRTNFGIAFNSVQICR